MSERARARAREGEERESVCASLHFYEWVADENMRGKSDSWDVLTTTISITARSISEDTDSVDGFSKDSRIGSHLKRGRWVSTPRTGEGRYSNSSWVGGGSTAALIPARSAATPKEKLIFIFFIVDVMQHSAPS